MKAIPLKPFMVVATLITSVSQQNYSFDPNRHTHLR